MTSFVPSPHFIDFTNFIIKRCIDNDMFYFTIFPLFIDGLLPFSSSNECKAYFKDLTLEGITDSKDYKKYFSSLFFYYNLLEERYSLQLTALQLIQSLASSAYNLVDARATEGAVAATIPPQQPRFVQIQNLLDHYILLNEVDSKILKAKTDFEYIQYWDFSQLHSFISGGSPDPTNATANAPTNATANAPTNATEYAGSVEAKESEPPGEETQGEAKIDEPPEVKVEQPNVALGQPRPLNTTLIKPFILKCIQNLKKEGFVIDLDSLFDDSPDLLFKKFALVICNNYTASADFNNAKFWVLSQLYSRL
jgi:hypothetical protein